MRSHVIRGACAAIPIVAALELGGCGPGAKTITVDKLAFGPAPPELHVGDTLQWSNQDLFEHTATARDASFDLDLKPGTVARIKLTKPGMINYYCRFHPGMTGVLKVER